MTRTRKGKDLTAAAVPGFVGSKPVTPEQTELVRSIAVRTEGYPADVQREAKKHGLSLTSDGIRATKDVEFIEMHNTKGEGFSANGIFPTDVLPKIDPGYDSEGVLRCNARLAYWKKDGRGYCNNAVAEPEGNNGRCRHHGKGAGRPRASTSLVRGRDYLIPTVLERIEVFLEDPNILSTFQEIASLRAIVVRIEEEMVNFPEDPPFLALLNLLPVYEQEYDEEGKPLPIEKVTLTAKNVTKLRNALSTYQQQKELLYRVALLERLAKVVDTIGKNVERTHKTELAAKGNVTWGQLDSWRRQLGAIMIAQCGECKTLPTVSRLAKEMRI